MKMNCCLIGGAIELFDVGGDYQLESIPILDFLNYKLFRSQTVSLKCGCLKSPTDLRSMELKFKSDLFSVLIQL